MTKPGQAGTPGYLSSLLNLKDSCVPLDTSNFKHWIFCEQTRQNLCSALVCNTLDLNSSLRIAHTSHHKNSEAVEAKTALLV